MDTNLAHKPFITVLLPVYNCENYLAEAILSILNQTYSNFEFIIIDDGSTDFSFQVISSFNDSRIKKFKNPENIGLIATLNRGISLASGEFIARMDQDDFSYPLRLEKQVKFMIANPEIGVLGSWIEVFGIKNEVISLPIYDDEIKSTLFFYNPICHPSVIIRKALIEQNNIRYNLNYLQAEDYQLWFQLLNLTKFHNIPEALIKYRIHKDQLGFVSPKASIEATKRLQEEALLLFGKNFTRKELEIWHSILKNTAHYSKETLDLIRKVCKNNRQGKVISPFFLERKLSSILKNCFLDMKTIEVKQFIWLISHPIKLHVKFTKKQKLSILKKVISNVV